MPWVLPVGSRNPNETVPDFPDDDNEAGGSLGKESGSAPLTGASAEVTAVDGAEEEDNGFETVMKGRGNLARRWLSRFQQRRWRPTGSLGSGPGSRNCPIPPHYNPNYRA